MRTTMTPPPTASRPAVGRAPEDLVARWPSQAALQADGAAIDWQQPIRPPRWLPRRYLVTALSQFLHGERVTAAICRDGLDDWPRDGAARAGLMCQIDDEDRHAGLFLRYLERLGDIAPVDPVLGTVMAEARAWRGRPEARLVAVNVLLEGEAIRMLDDLGDFISCPLFTQIRRVVARDEARHVALGRIVLKDRLALLDADERRDILDWSRSLWRRCTDGVMAGMIVPGVLTAGRRRRWRNEGWVRQRRALAAVGLIESGDEDNRTAQP